MRTGPALAAMLAALPGGAGLGQALDPALPNLYGMPGVIDLPSANVMEDGTLAVSTAHFGGQSRNAIAFQATPDLTLGFRYSKVTREDAARDLYDRSLSLHYRLAEEGRLMPALAMGLTDFLGTGVFQSEYVVATKTFGPRIEATLGLGWGRLGTYGGFENPLAAFDDRFATRPDSGPSLGGEIDVGGAFRGDAALFGGLRWQASDRIEVTAEYSSDAYDYEREGGYSWASPLSLGVAWAATDSLTARGFVMHGENIGVQLTWGADLNRHPYGNVTGNPAPPLRLAGRPAGPFYGSELRGGTLAATLGAQLNAQGMTLHGFTRDGARARVEVENVGHVGFTRAAGRAARVLSRVLPDEVTTFRLIFVEAGMPLSEMTLTRAALEAGEFAADGNAALAASARVAPSTGPLSPRPGLYPRLDYGILPYVVPQLFDPDAPLSADAGIEVSGNWQPAPGIVLSGSLRQRLLGNLEDTERVSNSVLPRVRSDANLYAAAADTTIPRLTAAAYRRLGPELYGRGTVGLLEPMFGGLSGEILWQPHDARWALGAEVNYVRQRDFDQLFGFQDYEIATGHVSGYWAFAEGLHGQVDVGRYLAGDWGATFALEREFASGWTVGAFATFTDVSFEDFGEGSFDKGLIFTIPLGWASGETTREMAPVVLRSLMRDGGARLDVEGRLYDIVRPANGAALDAGWGSFWQ